MNTGMIRFYSRKGVDVVVSIHPWKGRWAYMFLEDMYGMSSILATHMSVAEAKVVAKAVIKWLNKNWSEGSVKYLSPEDGLEAYILHVREAFEGGLPIPEPLCCKIDVAAHSDDQAEKAIETEIIPSFIDQVAVFEARQKRAEDIEAERRQRRRASSPE